MKKILLYLMIPMSMHAQMEYANWPVMDVGEFSELLSKTNKKIAESDFSARMNYQLFGDQTSNVPLDQDAGYFKKMKDQYMTYSMDILTLQTGKLKLIVDSANKLILVKDADKYLSLLPNEEEIRKCISANAVIRSKSSGNSTSIFIETNPQSAFASYLLVINKSGFIESLAIFYHHDPFGYDDDNSYFVTSANHEKKEMLPVLKINFQDYKFYSPNESADEFEAHNYVLENNQGRLLSRGTSAFEVKDMRIP